MSSIATLYRRIDIVNRKTTTIREQKEDSQVLDLISASLYSSLAAFNAGDNIPEREYTPEQRAALDRFSRRYNCAGAKDALLRQLEIGSEIA